MKKREINIEKSESIIWIKKAESDLRKAKILFKASEYDGTLFYSQQTAEKALKAVHINIGLGLIKSHELGSLSRRVKAPKNIQEKGILLNPYESFSRYPDKDDGMFDKGNSVDALKYSQEVLAWCKRRLKI
ncbi:HEPN domain-containing protein [Candidatus Pacearchaeota archaeon]|nr:HEPN domain-containing protein [Candidatus Pacearchaeota archaeon]